MRLRVLTYNIHKGIGGLDRRYDLSRIVETIRHYQPDVALLQEVDEGVKRSCHDCQVDLLAEAVELPHRAYQRNVRVNVGHYGNAVLSRFPLIEPADFDLTIRFKKRRCALLCQVQVERGDAVKAVAIANVHLGLAGFERRIQLRRLLDRSPLAEITNGAPLIVAGDFNDVWENLGRRVMHPAGFQLAGPQVRTFPAAAPLRRLDRVFYRGELDAISAFAGHNGPARRASDHLPLIVDFDLG